jgi:hypothetical protein
MTIVFIENILGSGQIIQVIEDFGGYVVAHKLHPGDSRHIAVSRFKSIVVNEAEIGVAARSCRGAKGRVAAIAHA